MVIGTPTVLNLIPGGVMKVIHVNQVNENIEIQFRIMNGAQPFNVPEGVSCTIRGTKGDNFGYAADVAVTAGSNIVTVTLTEQLTAVAGAGNIFELVFVGASDDMKVSTENFLLDVERAALGENTVISDSDLAYADQVLDQLQSVGAVNAQVQQNKANIAAEITRATAAEQTLQQNINAEAAARQAADNTLQSNINAEASSRATTDASLQSQINQLVAPSGEAPSAAEVQNARIGTDGTVYPTLGDAIRTQNSLLKSHLEDIIDTRNLFWDAKFVSGKYYYGTATAASSYGYFIVQVTSGQTYTFGCIVRFLSSVSAGIDNTEHAAGYQYTPDFTGDLYVTVLLAQADQYAMCLSTVDISEVGTTEAPRLAQHLLAQESGDSASLAMSQVGVKNAIASTAVLLDGEGQVAPENIEGVTVTGGNVLDDAERIYCTHPGYVGENGYVNIDPDFGFAIVQRNSGYCTFLIPVKPNNTYTANHPIRFMVLLGSDATSGTSPVNYTDVIGTLMPNVATFETGDARFALVSFDFNTYPIDEFIISKGNTATVEKTVILPAWWTEGTEEKPKFVSTTGNLSNGTFLALMGYKQNLRKGERYVFSGNIGTISSLHFGFTYANTFFESTAIYNEFIIDNTNITYKTISTNENYTYQYAHGLTLENNLQFIFEYLPEGNAKITLISNGMMFTQTFLFTKRIISQVVVLSTGSTLTDCKLTWTPIDIDKAIWMFGDSYFAYSAERWTYYLQQYGYAKNALIDGWPGEGSVNARNSLLTLIQFGTPKYIVWCMGMNDGSDTDASTPNSDWTTRRDEMLAICNANDITPIFATIPNVPSVLNTGKNAWIKASGYRYIDFAAAVGAESAGSTWFSGMLSSDNVHPSESGAKALFARALVDFPEIMLND